MNITQKKKNRTSKTTKTKKRKHFGIINNKSLQIQKGGGFFSLFIHKSGSKIPKNTNSLSELNKKIVEKFTEKFENRITYFEDETIYNPYIIKTKDKEINFFENSPTLSLMNDFTKKSEKDTIPKIVHTIVLHGKMKAEKVHHVLPPNIILCNIATPKTANINMTKYNFSIHNFFFNCSSKLVKEIFKERTLHSIPNNFKMIQDSNTLRSYKNIPRDIEGAIECFKKANWYYPGQKYFDISLSSIEPANKIFHADFYGSKKVNRESKYPNTHKTSLSSKIEKFSKDNPESLILVINTSCQPFPFVENPVEQKKNNDIINYILKYNAITYDLNLSLDEILLNKTIPNTQHPSVKTRGPYIPYCKTINERFINLLIPAYKSDYYFTNPVVKRSYNLDRDYPFFRYIEKNIQNHLSSKEIRRYSNYIDELSFRKKLIFYYKLCTICIPTNKLAYKNFNKILQVFRDKSYFIADTVLLYKTLYLSYNKNFKDLLSNGDDTKNTQILEDDLSVVMEILKIIIFSDKYRQINDEQKIINQNLQTFFFGQSYQDMAFFYQQIFPYTNTHKFKKLKLLKLNLPKIEFLNSIESFRNVKELDYQNVKFTDIKHAEKVSCPQKKKVERITVIDCPQINIIFEDSTKFYGKLVHLYLDNVTTNTNLVFHNLPLKTIVLKNLPSTNIINLKNLKLKFLKMHLIKNVHLSCERVSVQDFGLTKENIESVILTMVPNKFEIKSVRIKDPETLDLYLKGIIKIDKPIDDITYTGEVSEGSQCRDLLNCIKGNDTNVKIWGKKTHFTLNLDWNTNLVKTIRKNYKKYLRSFSAETM